MRLKRVEWNEEIVMELTLMSREYCGLCRHMREQLSVLQAELGFELTVLDVDDRPEWVEKYDELVPVLLHGDTEICHWHLDEAALRRAIAQ